MNLTPGSRLGVYEVAAQIGEGGMGRVYRATDTTLGRQVAIKILPGAFATDPDRVARFEREAKALAALNHPHIAAIYGFEKTAAGHALIMELVEGDDVSALIAQGPLPLDEALSIARQTAEALEAAHSHGIIHRDLKPANIKVRTDGTVKVLDFGLAKAVDPTAGWSATSMNSPTLSLHATQAGMVLGTAAYMSPEQARGKPVDKRADIWALGCVLFEMLTGVRAFAGEDTTDTIAAVVTREPNWAALPPAVQQGVRRLLKRSLEKDPKRRLDSAAVVRLEIDEGLSASASNLNEASRPAAGTDAWPVSRRVDRAALLAVAVIAAIAGAALTATFGSPLARRGNAPGVVTRTLVSVTPAETLQSQAVDQTNGEGRPSRTAFAVAPDGRVVVFSAQSGGRQQLFVRALDRLDATPIPGTESGHSPFFSPDGQWIGFQAGALVRKVPLAGGAPPTTICEALPLFGASWGKGGTIVYGQESGGLWRVPEGGGIPQPLTSLDAKEGEYSHRLPHFLPDGDALVFTSTKLFLPKWDEARLSLLTLPNGNRRDLGPGADARYVSSGHLVFMRSGTLAAAPFDLSRHELTGNALTVLDDVLHAANMPNSALDSGAGQFAVSESGALLYVPGGMHQDRENTIVSVDRQGKPTVVDGRPRAFLAPLPSPDESRLVVWTQGLDRNVWTYDRPRGTLTRLTTEGRNHRGIWTPDGKRITYSGGVGGAYNLFWVAADGSGPPERLTTNANDQYASSWSPDGETLAYLDAVSGSSTSARAVMAISVNGDRRPRVILQSKFSLSYPEFSPDGKWLAYVSNESGRDEVYVQPYPGGGSRKQISNDGGNAPAWARNARELFYNAGTIPQFRLMVAPITLSPFSAGASRLLFEGQYGHQAITRGYGVSADGQRFFLTQQKERPPVRATQMVLVQNWLEELNRRVPAK